MLRQDSFMVGAITGIVFSGIMYYIFFELNRQMTSIVLAEDHNVPALFAGIIRVGFSDQFIAIMGVASNIIPFLFYNAANKYYSMRGLLGVTTASAIILIIIYSDQFL